MSLTIHKKNKLTSAISMAIFSIGALSVNLVSAQESNQTAENDGLEVIEVTGSMRASYEGAIGEKRIANTVVEVLTSEDIGQFVDDSIAGALQRMPGIQIEEDNAGTDGDRVSIRGLGPQFVNSSINGRTLLSSGNEAGGLRKMNFNVFPSTILSGVRVAKGQTARDPESGLAGQVDLQTLRPLDLAKLDKKQQTGTISYKHEQGKLGDTDGGLIDGVFAWRNEAKDIGFYFGGVAGESDRWTQQASETKVVRNLLVDNDGDGLSDETLTGVSVPNAHTARTSKQVITRKAFSGGVQWQPNEDINIVYDATFARFNNESQRDNGQLIFNPVWGATVFDADAINVDEDNVLRSADFSQTTGGGAILSRVQDMRYSNFTDNFITGLNVDWVKGDLTTNVDIYYSDVKYSQDLRFPIFNKNLDKTLATYDNFGVTPKITTGADRLDPTGYTYLQSVIREIELDGKNHGATVKFNYILENNWIDTVDFGVHYEKTDIQSYRSLAPGYTNPEQAAEIAAAAISGEIVDDNYLSGTGYGPATWLKADFDAVGAIDPTIYITGIDNIGIDAGASHESIEEIFSLYAQANIDSQLAGMSLTGNVGVRAVNTKNEATALTVGTSDEAITNTTSNDYWEYLPSVNFNLGLTDDSALRFGFSKTLSRPEYAEMAPIISGNLPTECDTELEDDCRGNAVSGNPTLDPMTSLNYDITYEYYNEYDGAAIASVFYKDVSDFIIDDLTFDQTLVGQPQDILFNVTQPVNFSDGEAKGFELGFYQPFDKLIPALKGFGVSGNYTKVKSSFDEDVGDSGFGFPGSSENNYNFVGFYEKNGFGVRLAYVYRDDFFRSLAGQGSQTSDARFTRYSKDMSINIRYAFNKNFLVMFNGTNLLDDVRRDHIGIESKYLDYFYTGRAYSLTARYNF
ncbi:TonB-dependent receptor [Paraglaciecola sp. L3A3]|uniref:TonB-dependent receptor n=1 Tax=Paraglaciecola sp. L3A3 TaxID=2686358 RepID=UPI00131BFE59|nr:TonB-dependent receptor [Paraglaciecola sp. L3A3]